MNIQKVVVSVIAFVAIILGVVYLSSTKEGGDVMMEEETMMEEDVMMEEGETMMDDISFSGTVLAGHEAVLLDFNKSDYDRALASDKIITLYFYANWCPVCKAEFPLMESAFNELKTDKVVGFRVNFNDNETDSNEKELAREFGVAYQHTKVFLKNGERVLKSPESWDANRYTQEINNLLN